METKKIRPHRFIYKFTVFFIKIINGLTYRFKSLDKVKLDRNKPMLILANHQTDFDSMLFGTCCDSPFFIVGTDNILSGKLKGKILSDWYHAIPKKKGLSDIGTIKKTLQALHEGYSVFIHAEGNRTFDQFQFYIGIELIKLIRKTKVDVMLYNFSGGSGIRPRFSNKRRKGSFVGYIKRIITKEEYDEISDEEFLNLIKEDLKVYDSLSGNLYKSNRRAEYLERVFFICPKCHQLHSLVSKGNYITCSKCGLKMEYGENLSLISHTDDFNISFLDWWNYQKEYIQELEIIPNEIIFSDPKVKMKLAEAHQKPLKVAKGTISINDKVLKIGSSEYPVEDIIISSVISANKLGITIKDHSYVIKGTKRFNALKYVFLFNKLDTSMKIKQTDKYFTLEKDI